MATWTKTTDAHGWTTYTRGACRIVASPRAALSKAALVQLYAPGCTSEHSGVDAAKRAAARTPGRGW